ncbi:hypothetical protein [Streptomyces sp. NPDC005989]|uniref:hypothetical protein n=1 Tax=Streptomyces sp. NPDC005989 TaxID=3156727 RepID=UPI0033C78024
MRRTPWPGRLPNGAASAALPMCSANQSPSPIRTQRTIDLHEQRGVLQQPADTTSEAELTGPRTTWAWGPRTRAGP